MRDLITGTLETYLSMVNNRMNEVVKVLTVITSFFMPLSFIAAFFGMNFFLPRNPIRSWMEPSVFWVVLVMICLTPFSMLAWLRRRGWL
jgi:magnesium transporter